MLLKLLLWVVSVVWVVMGWVGGIVLFLFMWVLLGGGILVLMINNRFFVLLVE